MIFRSPHADVEIPVRPLTPWLLELAAARPDKPAFIDGASGRVLTHGQWAAAVRRGAHGLAARGFRKGDVFAIYSPNVPEYAVAFHAVALAGGVATTVNPLYTADELGVQLNDCGARVPVDRPPFLDKAREAAGARGRRGGFVFGEARARRRSPTLLADDGHAAGRRDRSARGRGRAALLERHDGPAQGRDAHPPQPGRATSAQIARRIAASARTTCSSACCRSSTSTAWS